MLPTPFCKSSSTTRKQSFCEGRITRYPSQTAIREGLARKSSSSQIASRKW